MMFANNYFGGKKFLVTGASSGIGGHISQSLVSLGAKVFGIGRSLEKLNNIQKSCKYQDMFVPLCKDISQNDSLDRWVLELCREHGGFDGAVLSAGIQQTAPISSVLSVESAKHLFEINYFGNLQIIKGLVDKRAKTSKGSCFVVISSNSSIKAQKGLANYSASKGALNTAIRSIALEIAPLTFRVNAISPGFVMTEMVEEWSKIYDQEYIENIKKEYPLGIGNVAQITPLVCFLLGNESNWITGQNIIIDGGASL